MTGNVNNTNLFLSIAVLVFLSLTATAQDSPYSADSLIATFRNGSQSPLKGTVITLSDRVVEVRRSSVTFKTSGNDKVTCEFGSPISQAPPFDRTLTVVGKVRGRGMLGNVTLDQCKLVPVEALASNEPAITEAPQELSEAPAEQVALPVEPLQETPAELLHSSLSTTVSMQSKSSALVQATTVAAPAAVLIADKSAPSSPPPQGTEDPRATECSDPPKTVPYGSHLLVALFAGIGTLTVSKLRTSSANRLRTSPGASADDVRRAALEALLSKHKK